MTRLPVKSSSLLKLIFFICLFFCTGCHQDKTPLDSLTKEEREDLNYLFRQIMDNESGAYVLFGSKPLCTGFLEVTPGKESQYWRDPENGWKAWEKLKNSALGNRYILVKRPFTIQMTSPDPTNIDLQFIVFADVKKTALVLAENYELFKSLAGMDFHPLEIVFELENPSSIFWNQIFNLDEREPSPKERFEGNRACGLLFGFGKTNSLLFAWKAEAKEGRSSEFFRTLSHDRSLESFGENNLIWSRFLYERGVNSFLIPGFIAFENDETVEQYRNERKKIQAIYRGRDFLEVTLQQLSKTGL